MLRGSIICAFALIAFNSVAAANQCATPNTLLANHVATASDVQGNFDAITNCAALGTIPTFNASSIYQAAPSGQKTAIDFLSSGSIKWEFGRNIDDTFYLLDATVGRFNIWSNPNGNLALMPYTGNVGIGTYYPSYKFSVLGGSSYVSRTTTSDDGAYATADLLIGSDQETRNGYGGTNGSNIMLRSNNKVSISALAQGASIGQISYTGSSRTWTIGEDVGWGGSVYMPGAVSIGTPNQYSPFTVQSYNGDVALNGTGGAATGMVRFLDSGSSMWSMFGWHPSGSLYIQGAAGTSIAVLAGGNGWTNLSDVRLKRNIKTLPVLARLNDYRAVSFDWKKSGSHDVGVIAQEIFKIFPEVVKKGSEGELSGTFDQGAWGVQYDKLGALALEAVKELKAENDRLRADRDTEVAALIKAVHEQQGEIINLKKQVAALKPPKITASNDR